MPPNNVCLKSHYKAIRKNHNYTSHLDNLLWIVVASLFTRSQPPEIRPLPYDASAFGEINQVKWISSDHFSIEMTFNEHIMIKIINGSLLKWQRTRNQEYITSQAEVKCSWMNEEDVCLVHYLNCNSLLQSFSHTFFISLSRLNDFSVMYIPCKTIWYSGHMFGAKLNTPNEHTRERVRAGHDRECKRMLKTQQELPLN